MRAPFGFPAALEASAWPGQRILTSTPAAPALLAPWLLNPTAQCSRPAWTGTRKKAARPHRRLSVGRGGSLLQTLGCWVAF